MIIPPPVRPPGMPRMMPSEDDREAVAWFNREGIARSTRSVQPPSFLFKIENNEVWLTALDDIKYRFLSTLQGGVAVPLVITALGRHDNAEECDLATRECGAAGVTQVIYNFSHHKERMEYWPAVLGGIKRTVDAKRPIVIHCIAGVHRGAALSAALHTAYISDNFSLSASLISSKRRVKIDEFLNRQGLRSWEDFLALITGKLQSRHPKKGVTEGSALSDHTRACKHTLAMLVPLTRRWRQRDCSQQCGRLGRGSSSSSRQASSVQLRSQIPPLGHRKMLDGPYMPPPLEPGLKPISTPSRHRVAIPDLHGGGESVTAALPHLESASGCVEDASNGRQRAAARRKAGYVHPFAGFVQTQQK